jgi:CheY-like chemotaxis protein
VRRILIVDDEVFIREVLAEVLADEGYVVQTATDGRQALEAIAASRPDLVITDVMMPHLSGWQLLQEVRAQHPALPVILISAAPESGAHREWLTDHTAFLAKPFALDDLFGLIMRLT